MTLVAGIALTFLPAGAAESAEWFGTPTPEVVAQVRRNRPDPAPTLGMLPLTVPPGQYADIRGPDLHRTVLDVVAFSLESRKEGGVLWGRVLGSSSQLKAAAYVERRFREAGLSGVRADRYPLPPQWWPTRAKVTVCVRVPGEAERQCELQSAMPAQPSVPAPAGGVEAEVVYVGLGRPGDLKGRDLRGKIALLRSIPEPGALQHTGYGIPARLAEAGAAGVLTILDLPGNVKSMGYGFAAAPVGLGKPLTPGVPSFTLGNDDGTFLEAVSARAPASAKVTARLELDVEIQTGRESGNVYGLVRGSTGEYIIVIAHLDAFFQGAVDNASGVATMVALAEHFARRDRPPRRNLLFVATGGHHSGVAYGRPGTPASPGTAHLAQTHPGILAKTVLVLNCEHTASAATARWDGRLVPVNTESPRVLSVTNESPAVMRIARDAIERYGLVAARVTQSGYTGDLNRLRGLVPALNWIESGYWYHTDGDVPEVVPPVGLERTTRAFADILDRLDAVSRADLERGSKPLGPARQPAR